ncbi:hypothetical protein J3F83DRAFT_228307 [Trichoderma novae-zelandiae]
MLRTCLDFGPTQHNSRPLNSGRRPIPWPQTHAAALTRRPNRRSKSNLLRVCVREYESLVRLDESNCDYTMYELSNALLARTTTSTTQTRFEHSWLLALRPNSSSTTSSRPATTSMSPVLPKRDTCDFRLVIAGNSRQTRTRQDNKDKQEAKLLMTGTLHRVVLARPADPLDVSPPPVFINWGGGRFLSFHASARQCLFLPTAQPAWVVFGCGCPRARFYGKS